MADNNTSLKLCLLDVKGSVDKDKKSINNLSMAMGSSLEIGRLVYTTTYYTRKSDDSDWVYQNEAQPIVFEFSLKHINFKKQMYSPNEIEAKILIIPSVIDSLFVKAFIPLPDLYNLCMLRDR